MPIPETLFLTRTYLSFRGNADGFFRRNFGLVSCKCNNYALGLFIFCAAFMFMVYMQKFSVNIQKSLYLCIDIQKAPRYNACIFRKTNKLYEMIWRK